MGGEMAAGGAFSPLSADYQRLPPTHTNLPRRLSLDENVHAKEGGKVRTLPMVPCGSSPVPRLYLRKTMRLRRKLERRNNL